MSNSAQEEPPDVAPTPRVCQNCAAPLTGPYCAQCGQHDVDYHRSLHHVIHDLLENLFHFEGKSLTSVAWLLAKPGKLTMEFFAGRRQSQLNPLRFYLFISVLFFLGVSLLNHGHLVEFDRRKVNAATRAEIRQGATAEPAGTVEAPARNTAHVHIDRSTELGRRLADKLASDDFALTDLWDAFEHRVPTLVFLGVPLFALFLKVFHRASGRTYIEHLVFSLHLHTWTFLVAMVADGYLRLAGLGPNWIGTLCGGALCLWMLWYVLASFRAVYGQGWRRTIAKVALLGAAHGLVLLAMALGLAMGTVFWAARG